MLKISSVITVYDVDDKVTQHCVLSKPWIKFQFHDLGVDHVVAGVPNGSWEHFNDSRFLHWTQICRQHYSRTKPCLTTIQLDSRHDYHSTYWQDLEFSCCFYWLRCVLRKERKGNKQKIPLNQTCFQRLWASFWFLNHFAGAGEKVTAHSCGSLISIFKLPNVWNNPLWSSKVRAVALVVWPMDEAGSCPQVDVKPPGTALLLGFFPSIPTTGDTHLIFHSPHRNASCWNVSK